MHFESSIDFFENSDLENVGIVSDHHGKLCDTLGIDGLSLLDFGEIGRVLHDSFLDWGYDLLHHLSDFGLHLKPFELLNFEFLVLVHLFSVGDCAI
jgi:hypothetical protein